jgi:FkbM family methyltransferase
MNYSTKIKLELIAPIFRFLPKFRGKYRLARFILGKSLETKNISLSTYDGCQYIIPSLQEPVGFALLIDGIYEPDSIQLMLQKLPKDAVFLDIGANIGVFTITAAKFLKQNGRVIAVEASPKIFPYLQQNIEANGLNNVKTLELAATERDNETVPFYEAPLDKFGMGSLAPQFQSSPIQLKTKTIDSILHDEQIDKVDFIKVDVEGYESSVFQGAEKLLNSPNAPIILFEFCDWAEARKPEGNIGDSQRVLIDFGYTIWTLSDFVKGGKPLDSILTQGSDMLVGVKHGS